MEVRKRKRREEREVKGVRQVAMQWGHVSSKKTNTYCLLSEEGILLSEEGVGQQRAVEFHGCRELWVH